MSFPLHFFSVLFLLLICGKSLHVIDMDSLLVSYMTHILSVCGLSFSLYLFRLELIFEETETWVTKQLLRYSLLLIPRSIRFNS